MLEERRFKDDGPELNDSARKVVKQPKFQFNEGVDSNLSTIITAFFKSINSTIATITDSIKSDEAFQYIISTATENDTILTQEKNPARKVFMARLTLVVRYLLQDSLLDLMLANLVPQLKDFTEEEAKKFVEENRALLAHLTAMCKVLIQHMVLANVGPVVDNFLAYLLNALGPADYAEFIKQETLLAYDNPLEDPESLAFADFFILMKELYENSYKRSFSFRDLSAIELKIQNPNYPVTEGRVDHYARVKKIFERLDRIDEELNCRLSEAFNTYVNEQISLCLMQCSN